MDKKPDQYNYLKTTIMELRFDMYEYKPFTDEVTVLQDRTLQKLKPPIDHPPKGSKDVSDAVGGVVARLLEVKGAVIGAAPDKTLDQKFSVHFGKQGPKDIRNDPTLAVGPVKHENHLNTIFED